MAYRVASCLLLALVSPLCSATTVHKPPICTPAPIQNGCAIATASYKVVTGENGATKSVSLVLLKPEREFRQWAECVAKKWEKFAIFSEPSPARERILEIRFESGDCEIPAL